jgi:hypothetical protein
MKFKKYIPKKVIDFWVRVCKPYFKDPLLLNKWDSPQSRDRVIGRITAVVNTGYKTLISRDDYKTDLFMFWTDMTNFIVPLDHKTTTFSVELTHKSKLIENIIIESLNYQRKHPLKEVATKFIEKVGQSLFSNSEVFYEIKVTKNKSEKITKLRLYEIYTPSVIKLMGHYFQIVPWKAARFAQTKAGIRRIPNDSILHIKFPSELGGTREIRKVVKRLSVISKSPFPDFHLKSFESGDQTGFDLNTYVESAYIEKAKLTKKFGWNQRKYQDNSILEYYSMHRHLQFVYSQTLLREHILKQLNKVMKKYLSAEIVVTGLLTTEEIKAEMCALRKGNLKFIELYKRTSRYS